MRGSPNPERILRSRSGVPVADDCRNERCRPRYIRRGDRNRVVSRPWRVLQRSGVTVVSSDRRMRPRFAISSNCLRVGGCAMFIDCRFSHLLDTILSRSLSPSTARTSRIVDGAHTQGKGEPSPGERTARSASSANLEPSPKSAAVATRRDGRLLRYGAGACAVQPGINGYPRGDPHPRTASPDQQVQGAFWERIIDARKGTRELFGTCLEPILTPGVKMKAIAARKN